MVKGLERFIEKFKDCTDCYTIIGGTACDILMSEQDLDFRATKDIDMIIIMEEKTDEFAKLFWEFINEGEYKCGWKNSEEPHYYRFTEPLQGYPVQIELFSKSPDYHLKADTTIIPLHIDDDVSSLSAILLNDDYYNFMLKGRRMLTGVSVLGAEYIIPFKMYAWLDLHKRKEDGKHVNSRDLRKHKLDVFRLLDIIDIDSKVELSERIKSDVIKFIESVADEDLDDTLQQVGVIMSFKDALNSLRKIYL